MTEESTLARNVIKLAKNGYLTYNDNMPLFTYIKTHAVLAAAIALVLVAGSVIAGRVVSKKQGGESTQSNIPEVALVEARTFRTGASTVSADGVIESVSQVDIKSQVSAPLSAVYAAVGDTVVAGQKIAELQNADIRAQLEQARASVSLAQGQYYTGGVSLQSARKSVIDKIDDAYLKADDAIHNQVDQFLYTYVGTDPSLAHSITDPKLADAIRDARQDLNGKFTEWKKSTDALSASSSESNIDASVAISKNSLDAISRLLGYISQALNKPVEGANESALANVNERKGVVTAARNSISGATAALTSAESVLANARATYGSSAEAQVSVANAGVKNLEAQLAKTIIISPISGKIAALPLRSGELASPGQLIATVVGSGALQVKAYASSEDFNRLHPNAHAVIQSNTPATIPGTVVSVAPSVSQTNKKIELKIAIADSARSSLVVGQSVQVMIDAGTATSSTEGPAIYLLPMQDVKIIPGSAYVFTVSADSKIVRNPVVLGEIRGEFVEVKSGLADDMKIVSPVYELNEGETVRASI